MLTVAFLIGTMIAVKRAKKFGMQPEEIINVVVVIMIASIVGSRLLYVLENIEYFADNYSSIFFVSQGGFSYHGALFLSLVVMLLWLKRKKISIGLMFDILAPSVALGFFFVRIGCFLNGCCFGNPTNMPWGVTFPINSPAGLVHKNTAIHPTQIYSSLSGLVAFFFLLWINQKKQFAEGSGLLFLIFLILSAIWRFIVEFFRYNDSHSFTAIYLTQFQIYCIGIFVISTTLFVSIYGKVTSRIQIPKRGF
jgi:phosphatidylglycerol:prolipoprotein diacylglycerol transferase